MNEQNAGQQIESDNGGVPCVVLAGGRVKPDLQAVIGQEKRALAVVNGKTLLEIVVSALEAAPSVGPITVVGDLPPSDRWASLPDAGDFVSNVMAGIGSHAAAPFVLVATSDLPFLTGQGVEDFVRGAKKLAVERQADIVWPVVPLALCYERFPGIRRTALKLREGRFTGGNFLLARPAFVLSHRDHLTSAYAARKSPSRLASMLGIGTVSRLLFSQTVAPHLLTVPLLEQRISRLLTGQARAYVSPFPEIATDLDRPSDFAAIQKIGF